jgi:flap endonuclease-1
MGIKGFFNVFKDGSARITEKDFKGKRVGIDVSYDIYRTSLGMKNVAGLTDKNGTPTVLLNILMCNIIKYKKLGVKGLIYVFDDPRPNPLKVDENKKRKAARKKAEERLANANANANANVEEKNSLEKRTFAITGEMVDDVKKMLNFFGVAWIVADKCEAEHLGAELSIQKIIDYFITSDSDALLFGAENMVRRVKCGKKPVYELYNLENLLIDFDLTQEQLIQIGVVLGCDFAEKTKGIGVKTVLRKAPDVKLTPQQEIAKKYFASSCAYDPDMVRREDPNIPGLIEWLVKEKNFNEARISAMLKVFS